METAGIFKAFAGDARLQTKINNFRSSQNTRISFDQLMTGKAGGLLDNNGILDFALDFLFLPLTAPLITSIKIRGYERVLGIGSRFNAIARNVWQLMQPDFVANLSCVLDVCQNVRSVIAMSSVYPAAAPLTTDKKVRELSDRVNANETAFQEMVDAFEADPTSLLLLELSSLGH
ncbi:hypothetical protein L7F22_013045 [Adiantum nelumboides]|nr:hypothetical protein [Adiantum nelumboides]